MAQLESGKGAAAGHAEPDDCGACRNLCNIYQSRGQFRPFRVKLSPVVCAFQLGDVDLLLPQ